MIVASPHGFLTDRLICARRTDLVRRMAATLVEADAFQVERDAIRLLQFKGFPIRDVFFLVTEAMAEAAQIVVAREMSAP